MPLAKIFNRNNVNVSYSCTKNITQIIKKKTHNNKNPYNNANKDHMPTTRNYLQT